MVRVRHSLLFIDRLNQYVTGTVRSESPLRLRRAVRGMRATWPNASDAIGGEPATAGCRSSAARQYRPTVGARYCASEFA
ncbi:MAG: hypothetical protein OWU32_09250 [Firmicutes bacterium]|nr:hypothetical protein [Bacillota bacterium]